MYSSVVDAEVLCHQAFIIKLLLKFYFSSLQKKLLFLFLMLNRLENLF